MFGHLFQKQHKLAPLPRRALEDHAREIAALDERAASATKTWAEKKRDYVVTRPSGDVEVFTGYTEVRPGEGGALEFWSPYQRELILHSSQWISVHVVEPES